MHVTILTPVLFLLELPLFCCTPTVHIKTSKATGKTAVKKKKTELNVTFKRREMELSSSLVLVLVLAVLMLVKWKRKASGLSLPPGPLALPLVGNLPIMDKSAPFKSFMKVRRIMYF